MRKPQGEREELFCLGAAAPNDFGGLSGWSLAIGGSVVKAELYLLNYTGVKQMELAAAKRSASMDAGAVSIVLETIGISVPDDSALHAFKREDESENSSDEEEEKDATKKTLSSKFKKSASGLARNVGAKVLKSHVAHADEEGRALQIYESYKVQALRKVPARCLVRQADGSVGFFVQPKGEWRGAAEVQRVSSELRFARAEGEALVARKGKLSAHDEVANAKLEAKLAEVAIAEGALEAKLARHRSTGLPKWRASMAEACRTIGMDAVGFALEEGFDPTAQAWPRFVPVIRLSRHRGLTTGVAYALKYQQEHAGFEVALEDVVATPMEVHRQLQVQYQRLQMQGLLHDKIMAQLSDLCGLPVAWKGARSSSAASTRVICGWRGSSTSCCW